MNIVLWVLQALLAVAFLGEESTSTFERAGDEVGSAAKRLEVLPSRLSGPTNEFFCSYKCLCLDAYNAHCFTQTNSKLNLALKTIF